jgi:hypothetical protein
MPAPPPMPRVPLGFPFPSGTGGPTATLGGPTRCYSEAGSATAGLSGLTVPPSPPAPNAPSSPTMASSSQTAHGTEASGPTVTPGDQTARPFAAPSLPASLTSSMPRVVPTTSDTPHAAPMSMTPPTPPMTLVSQHYSRRPQVVREPPAPPLHQ